MKKQLTKIYKKSISQQELKAFLADLFKCDPNEIKFKFEYSSISTIPTGVREVYVEWSEHEDI